jgi:hypothetical protein
MEKNETHTKEYFYIIFWEKIANFIIGKKSAKLEFHRKSYHPCVTMLLTSGRYT